MVINKMAKIKQIKETNPAYRHTCTELELHAYVDNELDDVEQAFVLESAQESAEIRAQLSDLKRLKELVRISYAQLYE